MKMKPELAQTLVDPKAFADFDAIHDAYSEIRRTSPVAQVEAEGFAPFWFVSKFDDVRGAERDSELFPIGENSPVLLPEATIALNLEKYGRKTAFETLIDMDGEKHAAYRALTQDWFRPNSLATLEPRIRRRMQQSLDSMANMGGECDFADDIALYYPLRVIMDVLGVEDDAEDLMLRLTQETFGSSDPDHNTTGRTYNSVEEQHEALNEVIMETMAYFGAMTEDRRKNPRNDLATILANGEVGGEPLGELERYSYYVITATAGHDTTSNSTSAGMWALCQFPELFHRLKADPSLIPAFVEESIRWESPVKHFMRTATRDTEIRGVKISKGDWLMSAFASACRCEDTYDDPFTFNIDRNPNRHMALGFGAHVCLGQHLARLEMRIFWEELLKRLVSVEQTGELKRVAAFFVSGPRSLPIRYEMQ